MIHGPDDQVEPDYYRRQPIGAHRCWAEYPADQKLTVAIGNEVDHRLVMCAALRCLQLGLCYFPYYRDDTDQLTSLAIAAMYNAAKLEPIERQDPESYTELKHLRNAVWQRGNEEIADCRRRGEHLPAMLHHHGLHALLAAIDIGAWWNHAWPCVAATNLIQHIAHANGVAALLPDLDLSEVYPIRLHWPDAHDLMVAWGGFTDRRNHKHAYNVTRDKCDQIVADTLPWSRVEACILERQLQLWPLFDG